MESIYSKSDKIDLAITFSSRLKETVCWNLLVDMFHPFYIDIGGFDGTKMYFYEGVDYMSVNNAHPLDREEYFTVRFVRYYTNEKPRKFKYVQKSVI